MTNKTACINGITGQVGSSVCEDLLNKGYKVYGLKRRASSHNTERIDHVYNHPNLELVYGDASDYSSLVSFIADVKPELYYNLMSQSHVKVSFDVPEYTMDVVATGTLRALEALRKYSPKTRFLNSGSSEQFGSSPPPQNEQTIFNPCSPYAVAKVAAFQMTKLYREAYSLFTTNSICFNMEGPKRGETFVTRKITRFATRAKVLGLHAKLYLGNLEAKRAWQDVRDSVQAMYLIITAEKPDDYVVGTDEMKSVRELLDMVFGKLNLDWKNYVEIDPSYFRPKEVDALQADASKITENLGWVNKFTLNDTIDLMIASDLKLAQQEKFILDSSK